MSKTEIERRDFLRTVLAGLPALAMNWDTFPRGDETKPAGENWDAIIVGSGLGGLSCAAAFARQGFKPLVLEQHYQAGGFATTFRRRDFVFDASLHSTGVGERNGIHNLIPGFPEITDIEFVPHKHLYRAIFPDYDIRVPHRDPDGYAKILCGHFPQEREGIDKLFVALRGVRDDIVKYSQVGGKVDMAAFPQEYPRLFQAFSRTWGEFQGMYIQNPRLRALVSSLWPYFGLPPSRLAALYYAMPLWGYLAEGGYYPIGKSQKISGALVRFIEERGGKVQLRTRVEKILTKDHAAFGVRTADGREFKGKVVVANSSVPDLFQQMVDDREYLKEYVSRLESLSPSISCFQVFLGLKKDLLREVGTADSEIFYDPGYDPEAIYQSALRADVEKGGFGVTLYDNLYAGYSPKGKNIVNLLILQGFDHWQPYAADYEKGNKSAYRAEKERLAEWLIARVDKTLLPGLRDAIEVKEIGTPLTHRRYTLNYRGAIYGWDQTLDNSGPRRLAHKTPVKNLFLSGAWTRPGHGYGAVIPSGLECFGEIMKEWGK